MSQAADTTPREKASDEVARYARQKRIVLARDVLGKTRIYLDTKYWVLLRDVRLGRPSPSCLADVLAILERLVQNGQAVCPVNADVFFEVQKQKDPATVTATVQLLDDLSQGISLLPMTERMRLEVAHFIESQAKSESAVFPLREMVWTKAAFILGFATPDCYNLPRELNVEVQRRFVDSLWELKLGDLVKTIGVDNVAGRESPFVDISSQLNQGKIDHAEVHKSFSSLFLSEVEGILDVYKQAFAEYMQYSFERARGIGLNEQQKADDDSGIRVARMIWQAFKEKRIASELPTIRIGASLHAALRWDRKRKYKANDLFDFRHAEAALPYCDLFLTEHSLRSLLNDRNLKLGDYFNCKVVSAPTDALAALQKIEASDKP